MDDVVSLKLFDILLVSGLGLQMCIRVYQMCIRVIHFAQFVAESAIRVQPFVTEVSIPGVQVNVVTKQLEPHVSFWKMRFPRIMISASVILLLVSRCRRGCRAADSDVALVGAGTVRVWTGRDGPSRTLWCDRAVHICFQVCLFIGVNAVEPI